MVDSLNHLMRHVEEFRADRKRLCPWYYSNFCSDEMHLCSSHGKLPRLASEPPVYLCSGWQHLLKILACGAGCRAGSSSMLVQCFCLLFWKGLGWAEKWLVTLPAAAECVLSWAEHLAVAAATCLLALIPTWRPGYIVPLAWVRIGSTIFTYPSHCIVLSV